MQLQVRSHDPGLYFCPFNTRSPLFLLIIHYESYEAFLVNKLYLFLIKELSNFNFNQNKLFFN